MFCCFYRRTINIRTNHSHVFDFQRPKLSFMRKGWPSRSWSSMPMERTNSIGSQWTNWLKHSGTTFKLNRGITSRSKVMTGGNAAFFVNRFYEVCEKDAGWMVIAGDICDWERYFNPNNHAILYSNLSTYTNWNHYGE